MAWKKILFDGDAAALSSTAPVDVDFSAASAGSAVDASRQDHKHDVPEALVGELVAIDGGAAAVGTVNKFVRADHKHTIGTLVAALNCGQQEIQRAVIHPLATPPDSGTEVEGQIYYDSSVGDKHAYIWVP